MTDLLGAVADEALWAPALQRYAASLGADQVGWFVLTSGPDQLVQWSAEFAANPDVDYWLQSPPNGTTLVSTGITAEVTGQYAAHYRQQDPLWHAAMAERARLLQGGRSGAWVVADAPDQSARSFRHTAFYNDFLRPNGIGTRMFGGHMGAAHPAGNLFASVYRQKSDEGFSVDQVQRFHAEYEALQRAAFLHREVLSLRARTQGLEALMERLSTGMLLFNTACRLLHANARARSLAACREHAQLRKLFAGPLQADARMAALFSRSLQGESGCFELADGLLLVTLKVGDLAPLGLGSQTQGVAWVLLERELDAASAVALVRQAYRLSPTEAALLLALLRGQTPRDFADARGVRIRTVRTQMSTLLLKTRTQRQQDLVALVARLIVLAPAGAGEAG